MGQPSGIREWCSFCGPALPGLPPVRCGTCGIALYRNSVPSASVIVERDSEVLMLRRAREPYLGHWDLPGGFCEDGEHPEVTAAREVHEETGLHVEPYALHGVWVDVYEELRPVVRRRNTLNVVYKARITGGGLRLPRHEVAEARWFASRELPPQPLAFPRSTGSMLAAWARDLNA